VWSLPALLAAWLRPDHPSARVCGRSAVLGPPWSPVAGVATPDNGAGWRTSASLVARAATKRAAVKWCTVAGLMC
jgi:hypothetical protein